MTNTGWSDIVPDVLIRIMDLLEIPDLISASAVCSSWSATSSPLRQRRRSPYLLFLASPSLWIKPEKPMCISLHSILDGRVYKSSLRDPNPPTREPYFVGSSHGWIFLADDHSDLHLVNPITLSHFPLPSVGTFDNIEAVYDGGVLTSYHLSVGEIPPLTYRAIDLRYHLYVKAVLSAKPDCGNFSVALIHHPDRRLSFARAGGLSWTTVIESTSHHYKDCLYLDGAFYALRHYGNIEVWDVSEQMPRCVRTIRLETPLSYSVCRHKYLVRAPWGEFLQVWRERASVGKGYMLLEDEDPEDEEGSGTSTDDDDFIGLEAHILDSRTVRAIVYRVDLEKKELVEVKDIREHALFLGSNHSVCISTKEFPGLKPNCAYFTDDHTDWTVGARYWKRDIVVYNLEDLSVQPFVSLKHILDWPPPVWITPASR